jgi:glutamine synthetase
MIHKKMTELTDHIRKGEIDTVIVAFPDHFGQLMGKRLEARFFLDHPVVESCSYLLTTDIEMSPLKGFSLGSWEKGYGDFQIVPDYSTIKLPSWAPATALILGDLVHEGEEIAQSPRAILKKQAARAAKLGCRPMMASELEFYLFENPFKEVMSGGHEALRPSSVYPIDYHILGTGYSEAFLARVRAAMSAAGITVESSKGETGRGQHEIALLYDEAVEMADRHILYKYGTKAMAAAEGKSVTFMAKYSDRDSGSSCHIHTSLANPDNGENLFWDPSARRESETFRFFLGGLHELSAEFFLFYAPNVNSYKRYTAGSFAPTRLAWDYDNRTTSFRVVGEGPGFRVENRLPGADANPYLAYAAMLAAGLYGMEHKIEAPRRFTGDAYHAQELEPLPSSLAEAAEKLDNSRRARELFGDAVVDHYVRHARLEAEAYSRVVGEWELKRYFERY